MIESDTQTPERLERPSRILQLLPGYYEVFGENPKYTSIDLYDVDDHEVAWMGYEGVTGYVDNNGRQLSEAYSGHELKCECDFCEGVGWSFEDDILFSRPVDNCPHKTAAVLTRHSIIRSEYVQKGLLGLEKCDSEDIERVMIHLMQKACDDEFLEVSSGAKFWGGFYYLQTVASITGASMDIILTAAERLEREKVLKLEGTVVKANVDQTPGEQDSFLSLLKNGWLVEAELLFHEDGRRSWQITTFNPEGRKINGMVPVELIQSFPTFGMDVSDLFQIQNGLEGIVDFLAKRGAA